VVGSPVVYACRMSGVEAGLTLLNQPAFEIVTEKYRAYCTIEETESHAKHEGPHVAYSVKRNEAYYTPAPPGWHEYREKNAENDKPEYRGRHKK